MRAEYVCGKEGWKARWCCVSCSKPLHIKDDAEITFINSTCARCLDKLLTPMSQHSYGVGMNS